MFHVKKYCIFSICLYYFISSFILNVTNAVMESDILNAVVVKRVEKSKFLSDVYIGEYKYRIYKYNPGTEKTIKDPIKLVNMFYIMMNCRLAEWTQLELFQFIERFPKSNEGLTNDYETNIIKYINYGLNYIEENVTRFVNILFELLKITTSFADTSLLKTLVFLQYKIHFVTSLSERSITKTSNYYDDLKFIFVKIINSIQNFTSLNCTEPTCNKQEFTDEIKEYFGYMMITCEMKNYNLHVVLDYITNYIHLELCTQCKVEQTLLKSIITENSQHSAFLNFSKTKVQLQNVKLSILDLFIKVTESYDLELILEYQEFFFTTMIKLICREILKLLKSTLTSLPININQIFVKINNLILPEINQHLYLDLANCFKRFAQNHEYKSHEMEELISVIKNYLQSFDDVILYNDQFPLYMELEDFIENVVKYKVEFECFNKYYRLLYTEFTKFYIPFLHRPLNIKKLISHNADEISTSNINQIEVIQNQNTTLNLTKSHKEQCKYVLTLCSVYSEIDNYLSNKELKSKFNLKQIDTIIDIIQNVSMKMIEQSVAYYDDDILNISYKLYVVLNTYRHNNYLYKYHIRRIVFAIMTYLNYYVLEYCSPLSKDDLLINNENAGFINYPTILENQLKSLVNTFTENVRKYEDQDFLKIYLFYNTYVKTESVIKAYKNVFEFYWQGEKKSIDEIFENIKSIVLNPSLIFSFYEVYFKFIIFASYYETKLILDYIKLESKNGILQKNFNFQAYNNFHNIVYDGLTKNNFPKYFSAIIFEIDSLITYVFNTLLIDIISHTDYKNNSIIDNYDDNDNYNNNDSNDADLTIEEQNIKQSKLIATDMQNNIESILNNHFGIFVKNKRSVWNMVIEVKMFSGVTTYCTPSLFENAATINKMLTTKLTNV